MNVTLSTSLASRETAPATSKRKRQKILFKELYEKFAGLGVQTAVVRLYAAFLPGGSPRQKKHRRSLRGSTTATIAAGNYRLTGTFVCRTAIEEIALNGSRLCAKRSRKIDPNKITFCIFQELKSKMKSDGTPATPLPVRGNDAHNHAGANSRNDLNDLHHS